MENEVKSLTIQDNNNEFKVAETEEERQKIVIFTLLDGYYSFFGDEVKEILPFSPIR